MSWNKNGFRFFWNTNYEFLSINIKMFKNKMLEQQKLAREESTSTKQQ